MTQHIIIGGGPAATNCFEAIRQFDSEAKITLISDEPAHSRMALPYWLAGQIPREHTHTADEKYLQQKGVSAIYGDRVTKVDPKKNSITLASGKTLNYDNLLIATGASPLQPPIPGVDLPGVQTLWTLADTEQVLKTAGNKQPRVVLVGAGFIGFIMLNAMYKRGWKLAVVEREPFVLPRMLEKESAEFVQDWLKARDVAVHAGTTVQSITAADDGSKVVHLDNGGKIEADIVVIATGIKANIELIAGSGIKVDQGILVNDRMQTNFPNIYAAGDVAEGPALYSDQPAVHSIQPTAVDHGRVAGANMAGQDVHYPGSLLMNVVDVCGLHASRFGELGDNAEATTISNPLDSIYRKFVWQEDQLIGAIFLGRPNDMGMLTDVGMIKGILQTQTRLGKWKKYLVENPFDVRRVYIGCGVAKKLVNTTLLGRPSVDRRYHFQGTAVKTEMGSHHAVFVDTKAD